MGDKLETFTAILKGSGYNILYYGRYKAVNGSASLPGTP